MPSRTRPKSHSEDSGRDYKPIFSFMQKTRHPIFHQMTTALTHQQNGQADLALAYWENVLRLLPDELRIHNEILAECDRIVQGAEQDRLYEKAQALNTTYQRPLNDTDQRTFESVYRAMTQQCSANFTLACVYWKTALAALTSQSLVITLGVQDLCWHAHRIYNAGNIQASLDLYTQIIQTFPDFLEGYLNLSIILSKVGRTERAIQVLHGVPEQHRQEFILTRYRELYQRISEVSEQFDYTPYAAIEEILNDLHVQNTFYPSIADEDFTEFITDIVNREKRFFEKRRKAIEEKAIARTSKRLSQEGVALGQRVTMAKQARTEEIPNFLYDNEIRITEVLLNNANITPDDVLVMAQTTSVSEVLTCIARHSKWSTFHAIVMSILLNPQTLPEVAMTLLPRLRINDLATIIHKKTLPTELRIHAKRQLQEVFEHLSADDQFAVVEVTGGEILKLLDQVTFDLSVFSEKLLVKFADHPDILVNICRWKLISPDVLAQIGQDAGLIANVAIRFALLSNPRTPMGVVIALLQSLRKEDLRNFMANKFIPPSVKQSISAIFPTTE